MKLQCKVIRVSISFLIILALFPNHMRDVRAETAGLLVSPASGLITTEGRGQANFTVRLTSQPTADVIVPIASQDTTEGTASPASLTFTPENWDSDQTVTVTGVNDHVADGDRPYNVRVGEPVSADPNYNDPLMFLNVSVTNIDNDVAGLLVIPTSGLTTTEGGGQANFTVRLTSQPTADVTVPIASQDITEGTASQGSLTFTPENWDSDQTVTVTGVNDLVADGDRPYNVRVGEPVSADPNYNDSSMFLYVSVTNIDNDVAGYILTNTSGLTTTEVGGSANFNVALTSQPINSVTVIISSSDLTEGSITIPSSGHLTFTAGNWNTPQLVTITGVDDPIDDGDMEYFINVGPASGSDEYTSVEVEQVPVVNIDNDTAALVINAPAILDTNEFGTTATFTVRLASQPVGTVSVPVTSLDTTEGTLLPASLSFNSTTWQNPQTVTVTGVSDTEIDGDRSYNIRVGPPSGGDSGYNALLPVFLPAVNRDINTAVIHITPTSGLVTGENGTNASFTITLTSQPSGGVTINMTSSNPAEGYPDPTQAVLTSSNWQTGLMITVRGVNDDIDDGDKAYTITTHPAISTDPNYNSINPPDISVINMDDDSAGVTVTPPGGLVTTEAGLQATITVRLNSQPLSDVTIPVASGDITEGRILPSSLVFTPTDWSQPKTITVTPINDDVVDGNITYNLQLGPAISGDPNYSGRVIPAVSVTNQDNDMAGTIVNPTTGLVTSENGTSDTFTVHLSSQPVANVTVPILSTDTTEGTALPGSLLFSTSNWSTPQTVTVTGVNDVVQDGPVVFIVRVGPATSTDPIYHNKFQVDVSVTNQDNDTAGLTIQPSSGLITTEAGGTAQYSVQLNTQPLQGNSVSITMQSSDLTEGVIINPSRRVLTFNPGNWNIPQMVTVQGVDDILADGDQPWEIRFITSSTQPAYHNLTVPALQVTNIDNDFSPVATNDQYWTNAEPLIVAAPGVLGNDTDANPEDILTAILVTGVANGSSLALNSNGSFTYQPNSNSEFTDSFTYRAWDLISSSNIGTVTIIVDLTPPEKANWKNPTTNNKTHPVTHGTVVLQAEPIDTIDFDHLSYERWDPEEKRLVPLGMATTNPFSVILDVNTLRMGWNQIIVFVVDKAGNRSAKPNNYIWLDRQPYYTHFIYLPVVHK